MCTNNLELLGCEEDDVSVLITDVVVLPGLVWPEHLAGREAYN